MKKYIKIALLIIVILAAVLRIYRLNQVPASLNWDEVDAGYNAYAIANWAKDEWGEFLPLVFTSFRDDKHPVHIYLTAVVVKIFGLSDFTTRLPGAIIGTLTVVVIFFLARTLFKNDLVALLSALFLAVSPYHLHFSRGLWEMNFALFFFVLGLLLFYMSLQNRRWLITLSFLSFGISVLSYHSSKIIIPLMLLLLFLLYIKNLVKLSTSFYIGILILIIFSAVLISDQRILGFARAAQTGYSKETIEKTQTYKKTKNFYLGLMEVTFNNYFSHFTLEYLFISGDQNPRNSVKTHGELYKIDLLLIIVGLFYLLKMKSKITIVLLAWFLVAPLPASLVSGAPNANRAVFMLGSLQLISALGAGSIISWFRGKIKQAVLAILLAGLSVQVYIFLNNYINFYSKIDLHDWQYGMKQAVEFIRLHPEYEQIFVTDIRSQPYIFFLFYLKMPLPEYLNTVILNRSEENKSFNLVSSFDRYYFGGWDPVESMPNPGVLYVLTPNQYDGLRHKSSFKVKKIVSYPGGGEAFYLVSVN